MIDISTGIFYFCLAGSTIAAFKHLMFPDNTLRYLTPVAFAKKDKETTIHPAGLWWGSIAFGCMNIGYATVGGYIAYKDCKTAKESYLLGTATMFLAFSLAWITRGNITGKKDYKTQAFKLLLFSALFYYGFFRSFLGLNAPTKHH